MLTDKAQYAQLAPQVAQPKRERSAYEMVVENLRNDLSDLHTQLDLLETRMMPGLDGGSPSTANGTICGEPNSRPSVLALLEETMFSVRRAAATVANLRDRSVF